MCGICGILGLEDRNLITRMCDVMSHRGPDDSGIFSDAGIMLGHRRLSIIDLVTGHQPMCNEDGSIWIVFNGEIYNYLELREHLEKKGHRFTTASDTEVIIHSYEEYGDYCVQKLRGDFSFAIWDSTKKKLSLARDRMGVKPLFYTQIDGQFIFASEIKAILQHPNVVPRVNHQSLHYILALRFIPGEDTMFEGIKKLLPGHILIHENGKTKFHKYWDLTVNTTPGKSEEYYIKNIQRLFKQAVERRLMSDVPLGVLLSGGIDSSSIVAVMSELVDEPLKTFCMGFGEPTDELNDAQLVADYFETDHTDMIVNLAKATELLPTMIWHADEPIINLPQGYMVCRLASKHVKVVNSGNGGDELFGGYIRYKYLDKYANPNNIFLRGIKTKIVSNLIAQIVKLQLKIGSPTWYEYRRRLQFVCSLNDKKRLYLLTRNALNVEDEKEKIYSTEFIAQNVKSVNDYFEPFFVTNHDFMDQVLVTEFKTKLVDDLLLSEDRVSMAHSLESRVPFLDTDLVEFAFTIPAHLKLKNGTAKYIFKKTMSNVLPKIILNKPKWGFAFTPSSLFKAGLKEYAEVFLSEENMRKRGYFNYDYIRRILNHKITPKLRWHYYFIMILIAVELWHRIYIDHDDLFRPKLDINDLY